jgi:sigma-B regulation protein RsbU (phosphoserine phosphatase)
MKDYSIEVLLIDDQAMVGEAVRRMLAPEKDIRFHFCQDPTKAIPKALETGATVILQDLVMPDVDGLSLVSFFRAHPRLKDVPLIVLSSKEEPVTKAEAFARGANDYLVKLPDRIELVARIRYHSRGYIALLQRNEAYDALLKSQQQLAAEVARAAEYVKSLLPQRLGDATVRTDWRFVPSTQLGGDSFGYHWIDPEHFAFYLLDVCGHGVGSALLSVSALDVLRTHSLPNIDFRRPSEVLAGMNDAFQMKAHNNMYFTLWYGVYDRRERRLAFSSGGHPPALLMNDCGIQRLAAPNMIVGGFPHWTYTEAEATVDGPSRLYLFSDGVYEVEGPDEIMWTLEELEQYLAQPPSAEQPEMDALYAMLQQKRGAPDLDDDFSIVKVMFE